MPGSRVVLAVSDIAPARERSWAAGLLRLQQDQSPRLLVDRVYHGSRPLVIDAHRVAVQRGEEGPEPEGPEVRQHLRIDSLSIDIVDSETGDAHTIYGWTGYETHLAGLYGSELIVYRVGPAGADLIGVHLADGAQRSIVASWPPAARDFSIDAEHGALIAQQLAPNSSHHWQIERVELATGQSSVLATSRHADMMPFSWPSGGVLHQPEGAGAPAFLEQSRSLQFPPTTSPLWVRATSTDGAWVAALGLQPHAFPIPVAIRVQDGRAATIPTRPGERPEIAGFVGGSP